MSHLLSMRVKQASLILCRSGICCAADLLVMANVLAMLTLTCYSTFPSLPVPALGPSVTCGILYDFYDNVLMTDDNT